MTAPPGPCNTPGTERGTWRACTRSRPTIGERASPRAARGHAVARDRGRMRVQVMHDANSSRASSTARSLLEPARSTAAPSGSKEAKGPGGRTPRRSGESSWPSREHSCARRGRGETSFPVLVPGASRDSSCVPRLLGDGRLFGAARPCFVVSRRKCALATPPVCGVGPTATQRQAGVRQALVCLTE
jgi:hypothetical protein